MKNTRPENTVIIATGKRLFEQVYRGHPGPATFIMAEEAESLARILMGYYGAVVLIDLSLFNDAPGHLAVRNILEHGNGQHIIVFSKDPEYAKWYELLQLGAQGFCQLSIADELLAKAIQTVKDGELWLGRQFVSYLMRLNQMSEAKKSEALSRCKPLNSNLTPREREIAGHVAQGKCDKLIARDLNISPNTVKNHLSNIFKKLEIADRFQLALIYHGIVTH